MLHSQDNKQIKQEIDKEGKEIQDNSQDDFRDNSRFDEEESFEETSDKEDDTAKKRNQVYREENRRERGRPKIVRTGQPGRLKKEYQKNTTTPSDPCSVSEVLERNDRQA